MKKILLLGVLGLLWGCGYLPAAYYAQKALGDSVYVQLVVNLPNPENSVQFKDSLNKAVISRFQNRLASQKNADSIITIKITKVTDTSIATNEQGFTTFYRATVYADFTYANKKGGSKTFENNGYYDYAVSLENPLVTYNNRFYAIDQAINQTIDKFITQVAYQGK
ncbi:hypothetical protein BKH46_02435 [Helicobacter sp. 12S02634-8]|uniref:LPS assembly lipoprotein LptE n=1 Tax=Helicobacter sp. 12S02634-8 TaxID=1476199 RepID=UPI000BA544D6|nr:LPS assembly lipoprotein LptE [Helicobacter sp. 12S02634-8]PAF48183.1 hypothetical protein BKH46_02435 [Helicobacter sp. 12S02634-8]